MAGITYLLQRHITDPSLSRSIAKEGVDAFEAVGPWFLTVLCLLVMGITVHLLTSIPPVLFYLEITYATALSLIIASPFHTMLNRFLADEIFKQQLASIINGLLAMTILVVVVTFGLSFLPVFFLSTVPLHQKIGFVGLTCLLSLLWCISSFLSSLKKERLLMLLFAAGIGTSLVIFIIIRPVEIQSLVFTFSLGIAIPVAGGYAYIVKLYLRSPIRIDWAFLQRAESFKIGGSIFVFYLGFWTDKFIFWFHPKTSQAMDPLFHYCAEYDYPFFVALTIMMIGSVLVYRGIKKKIADPYETFIFKLSNNFPFREIALEKFRLVYGIGRVSSSILIFYGGIVVFILFLVYLRVFPLPWRNPFVFHYLIVGTIFFSLYFFFFLVLQYLDDYTALLKLNFLFLALNTGGTFASIRGGIVYYGIGFMVASMISSLAAFAMVNSKVGGLEFYVFKEALQQ